MQKIFIGDVQGCADEFDNLLDRAEAKFGSECEVWLVGDLINRGPANLRVLERVRSLVEEGRCHYVLGNHEIGLVRVWMGLRVLRDTDTYDEILDSKECEDWLEWIRRRPLACTGEIDGTPFAMVHASLHPEWRFDAVRRNAAAVERRLGSDEVGDALALLSSDAREDAESNLLGRLVSARSADAFGRWSSRVPDDPRDAWHARWASRDHGYGVVYGHWALQGLHREAWLRGLDTGCVHHGRDHDGYLTAWVPAPGHGRKRSGGAFGVPDHRFLQVRAKRCYYGF